MVGLYQGRTRLVCAVRVWVNGDLMTYIKRLAPIRWLSPSSRLAHLPHLKDFHWCRGCRPERLYENEAPFRYPRRLRGPLLVLGGLLARCLCLPCLLFALGQVSRPQVGRRNILVRVLLRALATSIPVPMEDQGAARAVRPNCSHQPRPPTHRRPGILRRHIRTLEPQEKP